MAKIAHLKVTCPQCSKYTSIYVPESSATETKVKCEHCRDVFVFGSGMLYEPVAYVPFMPAWAAISESEAAKKPAAVPVQCKKCGKTYSEADVTMDEGMSQQNMTFLNPSNPAVRKQLGMKTLMKCSSCSKIACSDCAPASDGIAGMRCPFCNTDYTIYSFLKPTAENAADEGRLAAQQSDASPSEKAAEPTKPAKPGLFKRLFGKG